MSDLDKINRIVSAITSQAEKMQMKLEIILNNEGNR